MKIRLPFALVGLAISFALPTYGQQKYLADRQTVQKISESLWEEAVLKGDAAAIAAHYTPDAVFVAPEGPIIVGRLFRNGMPTTSSTGSLQPSRLRGTRMAFTSLVRMSTKCGQAENGIRVGQARAANLSQSRAVI
jgi:hypothetical protein